MRMRRSSNNRPFRRGPRKPNHMEGLPADEPDLPLNPPPPTAPPLLDTASAPPPAPILSPSAPLRYPPDNGPQTNGPDRPDSRRPFQRRPFYRKNAAPFVPEQTAPPQNQNLSLPQGGEGENRITEPTASFNAPPPPAPLPPGPHLEIEELQAKPTRQLKLIAKEYDVENFATLKKHDLICEIVKRNALRNGTANGGGVIDLFPEGYGFLRSARFHYLTCPEDIYVTPSQVRRFNLRKGEMVYGPVRAPKDKERFFALARVDKIEGKPAEEGRVRTAFDLLTPMFPNRRIFLEGKKGDVSMRAMDLICPLGFGQRGLIVAPPRTGKTILLQKIANAIMENNPKAHLIMLLIDERPEEVTDMLRTVKGEVIASTFDETCERHVAVAEMVTERAKRLAENGIDVVILLDSITRLSRAYNTMQPSSGKIMSGGVESNALQKPKRFFGAARNIQEGGSLTIIATALIETGSRMDDVIFEEFKGTGNMEVNLDRNLSDQRVFPAFNIARSGTRKEELLYHTDELPRIHALRRVLAEESPIEAMNLLLEKIKKTENNIEFLMALNVKNK
jgi:transcription termination factor Rho